MKTLAILSYLRQHFPEFSILLFVSQFYFMNLQLFEQNLPHYKWLDNSDFNLFSVYLLVTGDKVEGLALSSAVLQI